MASTTQQAVSRSGFFQMCLGDFPWGLICYAYCGWAGGQLQISDFLSALVKGPGREYSGHWLQEDA